MKKIISTLLVIILLASVLAIPVQVSAAPIPNAVENAVLWAINTANDDSHGYSQANRWGNPDYDCASFVISAFRSVGFKLSSAVHCGNMKQAFIDEGFEWIPKSQIDLSTSKNLKRGDILLNTTSHTEIYIGNNMQVGAHDGTYDIYDYNDPGDSTGKEICAVTYNNWSNWEGILRYTGDPLDIGTDFYAYIINNYSSKNLTNDNRNVSVRTQTGEANQVWKFEKRSNGSYKITNCADGNVLDVSGAGTTDGTNVGVYTSNDRPAQQWYIYGEEGAYKLKPACNGLTLDASSSTADGTNVRMWTDVGGTGQKFKIVKLNPPQSTYVECVAGDSQSLTYFWWNMTLYTTSYDIKIYNTSNSNEPYIELNDLTETSCSMVLPAGDYEAYVESHSSFTYTKSMNTIQFTVEQGEILGDVDGDLIITVLDATEIQKYRAQLCELSTEQLSVADTDKDELITVLDATRIQCFLAQLIDEL